MLGVEASTALAIEEPVARAKCRYRQLDARDRRRNGKKHPACRGLGIQEADNLGRHHRYGVQARTRTHPHLRLTRHEIEASHTGTSGPSHPMAHETRSMSFASAACAAKRRSAHCRGLGS